MKKAIIIGALGFIGFALSKRLLEEDFEVYGIDVHENKIQDQKLSEIVRNSYFTFINSKVDDIRLEEVTDGCDVIYYCILDNHINESNFNEEIQKNKIRLNKIMDYCQKGKCKFIYLSSYEVFSGNELAIAEKKDRNTTPRNVSGKIKAVEEKEILKYNLPQSQFSTLILQLPTVYGPWQPDTMTFQQLITGSHSPSIDPIQEDIIFIDDVVDIIVAFSKNKTENETILIGSNKKNQWLQAYNLLTGTVNNQQSEEQDGEYVKDSHKYSKSIQTSIKQGISLQKDHYNYLQKLKSLGLL